MITRLASRLCEWSRQNPFLLFAAFACVGIIAAEHAQDFVYLSWAAAGMLLVCLWRPRTVWVLLGVVLTFAALHQGRLRQTFRHPLRAALLQQPQKRILATVRGSLRPDYESRVMGRVNAACSAFLVELDDGSRFETQVEIMVRLPRGVPFPGAGEYELRGELHVPHVTTNPGVFDAQTHTLRRGFVGRIDAEVVRRLPGRGEPLRCALLTRAEESRQWISDRLTRGIRADAATAGVIRGMALGVAEEAQEEVEEAFRDSGTLHVFAVSGLHVGLLGLILHHLFKMIRLRRSWTLPFVILSVVLYAYITGWRPSAARSAWMIALMLLAGRSDRGATLQNTLGLAALALFVADTQQLFLAGFQLSFGVLWGISLWADVIAQPMQRWAALDAFLPPRFATEWQLRLCGARKWFAGTLSVSIAAWLGSTPFILLHFQSITPVAVLANLVLVPLSVLGLMVTCLAVLSALPGASAVLVVVNHANWFVAKAMIVCATWFAALPGANFHFNLAPREPALATWRVLDTADCGSAHLLRVHVSNWLFDTGPESGFRVDLKPVLRSEGVNHIEGIFLSHNDSDHIGAAQSVVADFGRPPLFCSRSDLLARDPAHTAFARLKNSSAAALLTPQDVGDSVQLAEKAHALCLHPSPRSRAGRGDDRAMVQMVQLADWRVLWIADAGWLTGQDLCESGADLRCDILIQSHCESGEACSTDFLDQAAPRLVIHASGPQRLEQQMPRTLVEWCAAKKVPLLDSGSTGTVLIRFTKTEIHVHPAQNAAAVTLPPHTATRSQK